MIKSFTKERDLELSSWTLSLTQREKEKNRRKGPKGMEVRQRETRAEVALGPETRV